MPKRPSITPAMKINALLCGFDIRCRECHCAIMPGDDVEWDHRVPVALGGRHHYYNLLPLHRECHKRKTFGTKATSAGSDIHKIAKVKRIAKGKMAVRKEIGSGEQLSSRPGEKGAASDPAPVSAPERPKRKMRSRPFPKRPEPRKARA